MISERSPKANMSMRMNARAPMPHDANLPATTSSTGPNTRPRTTQIMRPMAKRTKRSAGIARHCPQAYHSGRWAPPPCFTFQCRAFFLILTQCRDNVLGAALMVPVGFDVPVHEINQTLGDPKRHRWRVIFVRHTVVFHMQTFNEMVFTCI